MQMWYNVRGWKSCILKLLWWNVYYGFLYCGCMQCNQLVLFDFDANPDEQLILFNLCWTSPVFTVWPYQYEGQRPFHLFSNVPLYWYLIVWSKQKLTLVFCFVPFSIADDAWMFKAWNEVLADKLHNFLTFEMNSRSNFSFSSWISLERDFRHVATLTTTWILRILLLNLVTSWTLIF